jgi:hypothetical protein
MQLYILGLLRLRGSDNVAAREMYEPQREVGNLRKMKTDMVVYSKNYISCHFCDLYLDTMKSVVKGF